MPEARQAPARRGRWRAALCGGVALAAAGAAAVAQPPTNQIRSLSVRPAAAGGTGEEVRIDCSGPPEWTANYEGEGLLALEILDSLPAPGLGDVALDGGLVNALEVMPRQMPGEPPSSRILVRTRRPVASSVIADDAGLTVRLRPAVAVRLEEMWRVTAEPCLRLRSGPASSSPLIECLPQGTRVRTIGSVPGWRQARFPDGRSGWLAADYLEAVTAPAVASVAAATSEADAPALDPAASENRDLVELARAEADDLRRRLRVADEARDALEAELGAARREIEAAKGRNAGLTAELEGPRAALEGRRGTVSPARLEQLTAERDAARGELAELGRRLEALTADLARRDAELAAMRRDEAETAGAAEAAARRHDQALADLQAELRAARDEIRGLEERIAAGAADAEPPPRAAAAPRRPMEDRPAADTPPAGDRVPLAPVGWEPAQQVVVEPLPPAVTEAPPEPSAAADLPAGQPAFALAPPEEPRAAALPAAEPEAPADDAATPELEAALAPATDDAFDAEEIAARVAGWAAAWSDQRVDDYLGFYAASFEPDGAMDRDAWLALRRVRLARPSFIDVTLVNVEVTPAGAGRAVARFTQRYRSNSFGDAVVKRLELERIDGDWQIVAEVVERELAG